MLLKTLPGLGMAVIIGALLCRPGVKDESGTAERKWSVTVARVDGPPERTGTPFFAAGRRSAPASQPAVPPVSPVAFALEPTVSPERERVAEVAAATVRRTGGDSFASGVALASANEFCGEETSAWIPTSAYPKPPIKGLEVWGGAKHFSSIQNEWGQGNSMYSHDGNVYSLGVRQDWSIDSVIGASVDILDATAKGRSSFDSRTNDMTGYFANAHYQGTLAGRYPVEMKGTYGRLYHEGSGWWDGHQGAIRNNWNESGHRSHYYGFSAKAGLPLLFGGVFKVLPEVGVEYRRIETGEFDIDLSDNRSDVYTVDASTAKSLMVPLSVTVKRDIKQCWGLVTPRAKFGYAREFEETGSRVRALNATAAGRPVFSGVGELVGLEYDKSQRQFWEFGAGLDVRTVGGWNVTADYTRQWSDKYTRDEFKLEMGRCF